MGTETALKAAKHPAAPRAGKPLEHKDQAGAAAALVRSCAAA